MTQTSNDFTIPWEGGAYSIKRHGVSILNCDSEPVQTPGCIQAHGALLVLRLSDLKILQASENTLEHLEVAAEDLLGKSVAIVLGPQRETMLRVFLAREAVDLNPLYLFTCAPRAGAGPLDVFVHTIDGLAVLEFEATDRGEGKIDPDYYALVKQSVTRLQTAQTLNDFCQIVTEEVRALTALDRVMVYRFHEDFHGEVVAESKREDLSGWLGLHYPAEDIPKPAREIFKRIWIRPLPDANARVVEMVPLVNSDTGKPLNMTHCCLRGASVIYTEYLQNMGVAASLTMAMHCDGELWGLVACHHYKPTHFRHQVRAGCEFLAQVASLQLRAAEQRENLGYRLQLEGVHNQLIAKATQDVGLKTIAEGSPNLLDGMNAGGAALYHAKRWWRMGPTPTEAQLDALKIWLVTHLHFQEANRPLYATNSLVRDYPDAAAFADVASGVLAVSIAHRQESVILWFRPETMQTVKWAGNPDEKPIVIGPHGPRLTPRKSFEIFSESVRLCALPWKTVELEAALRLRLLIIDLVVSRAEQLAQMNADLTRSNEELDAFAYVASHDLKEPLRGISRYAHQLLEGAAALDEENRKRLQDSCGLLCAWTVCSIRSCIFRESAGPRSTYRRSI